MTEYIIEYRFDTAKDLLGALVPWSQNPSLKGYIFRGHSDSKYDLVPTALREGSKSSIWDFSMAFANITGSTTDNNFSQAFVEFQLVRDFYRQADIRGLKVPVSERLRKRLHQKVDFQTMSSWIDGDRWLPDDMLEVAALAQHYGVLTRLLDWTYDPLVAAFFASKPPGTLEGDLCIWGFKEDKVGVIEHYGEDFPLRIVTPHYEYNPNLAAQNGLFTHWAHRVPSVGSLSSGVVKEQPLVDRRPLDVLLVDYVSRLNEVDGEGLFVKLILPNSQSLELARLLRDFGYGPAKIFPGYEGVAMELKERPIFKAAKESKE